MNKVPVVFWTLYVLAFLLFAVANLLNDSPVAAVVVLGVGCLFAAFIWLLDGLQ